MNADGCGWQLFRNYHVRASSLRTTVFLGVYYPAGSSYLANLSSVSTGGVSGLTKVHRRVRALIESASARRSLRPLARKLNG